MENVYKIKIRTNSDNRGLYPSERRYSASIVCGMGIVHISLAVLSLIFTALNFLGENYSEEAVQRLIQANEAQIEYTTDKETTSTEKIETNTFNVFNVNVMSSTRENSNILLVFNKSIDERQREVMESLTSIPFQYTTLTSVVMAFGALLAGLSALLAWKRWYIDNNIKWLFVLSCLSILSSGTSLMYSVSVLAIIINRFQRISHIANLNTHPKLGLTVHILLTSLFEFAWSVISTRISFRGMMSSYPDDAVVPKGCGKIEVNTVRKGNKRMKMIPPDILSHFHMTEKIAKYLPKRDNNCLPNAESNSEYKERIRKFLSSNVDSNSVK